MKISPFILTLAAGLALGGCHKGHSKNPLNAVKEAVADKRLQKSWQSECSQKPIAGTVTGALTFGEGSVKSVRTILRFAGDNVTRTTTYYSNSDCSNEAAHFDEAGSFKIDESKKSNDGGKNIDIEFKNLMLTVVSEEGAKVANAASLCRKSDWSANSKAQDVTAASADLKCYALKVPRRLENIYRADNDGTLQTGDWDSTGRPSRLSQTFSAKK